MKLTEKQIKELKLFSYKADVEGFAYACTNYPIKDDILYDLLCKPVADAEEQFEQLREQHGIEDN